MQTVVFETDNAIFYFESSDAICCLKHYSEHKVRGAIELLETISSSSSEVINIESDYFGFTVLDLLKNKKGSVFCKSCQKIYLPGQLRSAPVGFGKSPFEVNLKEEGGFIKKIMKKLVGKKEPKITSMRGGEKYECKDGHELISMITWIT